MTLIVTTTYPKGGRMVREYPDLDLVDGFLQLGETSFYTWSPEQSDPHQPTDESESI